MKKLWLLLLILWESASAYFDVVLDMDWTLIYTTTKEAVESDPSNTFEISGVYYRSALDLEYFLYTLHQYSELRISTFSGGNEERNRQVIFYLYHEINELFESDLLMIPFKVLNSSDLTVVDPLAEKFSDRNKKDLEKIDKENLENMSIFDDQKFFSFPGQEKNMIWLQQTFDDIPDFEAWQKNPSILPDIKWAPKNYQEWWFERYKLHWMLGLIDTAVNKSRKGGNFRDHLFDLTHDMQGNLIPREFQLKFYQLGAQLIQVQKNIQPPCLRLFQI